MNIFKILASGHGSISETNVSAFLGYLLDPHEDHGLGDEFLSRLIQKHYENQKDLGKIKLNFLFDLNGDIRSLNSVQGLSSEVYLEQSFQEDENNDSKRIIDIVVICFENKNSNNKSNYVTNQINNTIERKPKHFFLIENKIKDSAVTDGQLNAEYEATKKAFPKVGNNEISEDKISLIYITHDKISSETPEGKTSKSDNEFKKTTDSNPQLLASHFNWKVEGKGNSIMKILKEIIDDEAKGEIEPLNEIVKHAIKSFILFIDNDFESSIKEKLFGAPKKRLTEEEYLSLKQSEFGGMAGFAIKIAKKIKEDFENVNDIIYTPTCISISDKINKMVRFSFIFLYKDKISITITKDKSTDWKDHNNSLKKDPNFIGIQLNERKLNNDAHFDVYISDYKGYDDFVEPLLKNSIKYFQKK